MTEPPEEPNFDPYRFGAPEHPVPPEYAPPGYQSTGYLPPAAAADPSPEAYPATPPPGQSPYQPGQSPYGPGPSPYGQPPSGQQPYGPPGYAPPGSGPAGYQSPGYQPTGYQPSGYQPSGYPPPGYPPPPGYGYPSPYLSGESPHTSGKAITGMVLGIAAVLFSVVSALDLVLIIPALIFSLIALSETRGGMAGGRGMAIAGICLVIVATIAATVLTVVYIRVAQNVDCSVSHSPGSFSAGICRDRNN